MTECSTQSKKEHRAVVCVCACVYIVCIRRLHENSERQLYCQPSVVTLVDFFSALMFCYFFKVTLMQTKVRRYHLIKEEMSFDKQIPVFPNQHNTRTKTFFLSVRGSRVLFVILLVNHSSLVFFSVPLDAFDWLLDVSPQLFSPDAPSPSRDDWWYSMWSRPAFMSASSAPSQHLIHD